MPPVDPEMELAYALDMTQTAGDARRQFRRGADGAMPVRAMARCWPLGLVLLALVMIGLLWTVDAGAAWARLVAWTVTMQRELHQALATALRAVAESGPLAGLGLVSLSFLYGVFHAAGPGHGKVVIATYLGTQHETLRRGVALAFASALLQGVVAIVTVVGTVLVLERTARQTQHLADQLERPGARRPPAAAAAGRLRTSSPWPRHDHGHHHAPAQLGHLGAASDRLRPCSGAILVSSRLRSTCGSPASPRCSPCRSARA